MKVRVRVSRRGSEKRKVKAKSRRQRAESEKGDTRGISGEAAPR